MNTRPQNLEGMTKPLEIWFMIGKRQFSLLTAIYGDARAWPSQSTSLEGRKDYVEPLALRPPPG